MERDGSGTVCIIFFGDSPCQAKYTTYLLGLVGETVKLQFHGLESSYSVAGVRESIFNVHHFASPHFKKSVTFIEHALIDHKIIKHVDALDIQLKSP